MKKKSISVVLISCLVLSMSGVAFAKENSNEKYVSDLPTEFDFKIALDEIESDILNYIDFYDLQIEYGSSDYCSFLLELACTNVYNSTLDDVTKRYYKAYASTYLANISSPNRVRNAKISKTVQDIRNENTELNNKILDAFMTKQSDAPIIQSSNTEVYDREAAQDYAEEYSIFPNLNYPVHFNDCTNFASQILVAGGFTPNYDWYCDQTCGQYAYMNWVTAAGFCEYWALERGYIGDVCFDMYDINNRAVGGDFLVWQNGDTFEYYHTQFVQRKDNQNQVHCTQHTPNYFDAKLSQRVDVDLGGDLVYQLDFT